MRKPVLGVSDQVQHKLGCTTIEDCYRLEILDLGSRGILLSYSMYSGHFVFNKPQRLARGLKFQVYK